MSDSGMIVRTLTCKRDIDMAIVAYRSFLQHSKQPVHLVIHTDGSLTNADAERLYTELEDVVVISQDQQEDQILELLDRYPNCRRFRTQHPLACKLLDIPLQESDCIRYVDGDILFLKPFTNLFSQEGASRFCLEDDSGYSGSLSDIMKISAGTVPHGCNTGIFQLQKKYFDIDFIEWFLGKPSFCRFPSMVEQTLFALFMGKSNGRYYKTNQVLTSKYGISVSPATVAIHFLYGLKPMFFKYAQQYGEGPTSLPSEMILREAAPLHYPYIIKRALKRKLQHIFD